MVNAIRYQSHPYIIFTKTPNVTGTSYYGEYITNNYGFVGTADTQLEKKKGITRVICIGGSTTEMAWGESPDNTYPQWLNTYLGDKYEVINAGCAGYTTAEMLINFELRLLDFKPDIIVLYCGYNDVKNAGIIEGFKSDYSHARRNQGFNRLSLERSINYYISVKNRKKVKIVPQAAVDAFKRNVKSIVSIAKGHLIVPVVVEFNLNPAYSHDPAFADGVRRNIESIKYITQHYVEVPDMCERDFWDDCHLNTTGMQKMGRAIANEIKR